MPDASSNVTFNGPLSSAVSTASSHTHVEPDPQHPHHSPHDDSKSQEKQGEPVARRQSVFALEPEDDEYLVDWDGPDDPANPLNWNTRKTWGVTAIAGVLILNATFSSSAPSGIAPQLIEEWGINQEVATLPLALFIAGYCAGPVLWGPLSERRGRRFTFLFTFTPYTLLQIGCALAPDIAALLVLRFLSGVFASAPLSVAGALIADVHPDRSRGAAMAVFSVGPFCGPALGPIVSGFITLSGTHWSWLFWVCLMFGAACLVIVYFLLPETFGPLLLSRKAERMRTQTGDDGYRSALEILHANDSLRRLCYDLLAAPFVMIVQEPMLLLTTLLMSYVYGLLYLLFQALPFIFQDIYHWNIGVLGLAFLPLAAGGIFSGVMTILVFNPRYIRAMDAAAPKKPEAETRLEPTLYAGPLFAASFFVMGWTAFPHVHPAGPLIGVLLCGIGCIGLFLPLMNYIVDTYLTKAATALSINTVMRSTFGVGFPLFANQLYGNLGVNWASTLLGCLALLMIPIPFLFVKYGRKLRALSKNAVVV